MDCAFVSKRCSNCVRFLQTLNLSDLREKIRIFDIDQTQAPPEVTAVPTLFMNGRMYVGKDAFDVLQQSNIEVEAFDLNGTGNLSWGRIDDSKSEFSTGYWAI